MFFFYTFIYADVLPVIERLELKHTAFMFI